MEIIFELLAFGLKALVVVVSIAAILMLIFGLALKNSIQPPQTLINVEDLNTKLNKNINVLKSKVGLAKAVKKDVKQKAKQAKKEAKASVKKSTIYVIDFDGDVKASAVKQLRDEVTTIIGAAKPGVDKVLVNITSQGGMVHTYGLAASQLQRFKSNNIELITSIDKVAASGGYMMACTGQTIICAPFAIVGSIGVVAQVPNIHRLLKKHDVDYEEITAGEYKRTVSMMGEITPEGKKKFNDQIQQTHDLFKSFVTENRPSLDISQVATGEYWYGSQAKSLGLVDELMTSDEFIFKNRDAFRLLKVSLKEKKKLGDKLSKLVEMTVSNTVEATVAKTREQLTKRLNL